MHTMLSIEHAGLYTYYTLLHDGTIIKGGFEPLNGNDRIREALSGIVDQVVEADTDMDIIDYWAIVGEKKMVTGQGSLTYSFTRSLRHIGKVHPGTVIDTRADGSIYYRDLDGTYKLVDSLAELPSHIIL